MKNLKNKIVNYKFLSSLNLIVLSLLTIKIPTNAMFKNPRSQMPLAKSSSGKVLFLTRTHSGVSYVMSNDERKSLISSNSTTDTLTTKNIFAPSLYPTQPKEESIKKIKTTPSINPDDLLNQLREGIREISQNQSAINSKLKATLEKSKKEMSTELGKAIENLGTKLKNVDFKGTIDESIQKRSQITTQPNSDLEKPKKF